MVPALLVNEDGKNPHHPKPMGKEEVEAFCRIREPEDRLVGSNIRIVGQHVYKGYRGIIKNVHRVNGTAEIEFEAKGNRVETIEYKFIDIDW